MSKNIFYSWQSDLPSKENRDFIEKSIKKAISSNHDLLIYMEYDRDTKGKLGSPDIVTTIFEKIEQSSLFICDISIINKNTKERKTPNPNVLIELGYAINVLGWDRIICIFNEDYGDLSDLPFDLRQRRITKYSSKNNNDKDRLANIIAKNIEDLYMAGKLYNPIIDYMKGKIDKNFLDIAKKISNIIYGTTSISEGLANVKNLLKLTKIEIIEKIKDKKIPLFLILDNYDTTDTELKKILDNLFSSNYFSKKWITTTLRLIDWIRIYQNLLRVRFNPNLITITDDVISGLYKIVDATKLDCDNPKNSKIILEISHDEHNQKDYGKVINTTCYPDSSESLSNLCLINEEYYDKIANLFLDFIELFNSWTYDEGSEIILDPNIYIIKSN